MLSNSSLQAKGRYSCHDEPCDPNMLWLLKFPHARPCPCTKFLSQKFCWGRHFLTLGSSQFQHIWADAGQTAEAYNNHPLAIMNSARRSMVLEDWARNILEATTTNCFVQDPVPGKCVDGSKRSIQNSEYDFLLNGRRVEIKGSQLQWNQAHGTWNVRFTGLRFEAFDDLYLVVFSPKWLDLIKYDLKSHLSRTGQGRECRGSRISIRGKAQWHEALDTVLGKLRERGTSEHLFRSSINDSTCQVLCDHHQGLTSNFYCEVPLSLMSPQLRGRRVERMVMDVDRLTHPNSTFAEPATEDTIGGRIRGRNMASCDWIRDEKRIEVKHSQLSFYKRGSYWRCAFQAVKHACFDELLLVAYSPRGLDIFKHDGYYGVWDAGVRTETEGRSIVVRGCAHDMNPLSALQTIQSKLVSNGCPHLAQILWDS